MSVMSYYYYSNWIDHIWEDMEFSFYLKINNELEDKPLEMHHLIFDRVRGHKTLKFLNI